MEKLKQKKLLSSTESVKVDVRWAVRWVEQHLWREGLLEKVCLEFRVEETREWE